MHQRDARSVIATPGVIHVIPAGEFAPADVSLDSQINDFNLWHTIMREYAEEFLDIDEAYGRGGQPLDYEHEWPYSEFLLARKSGSLRVHTLGVGLDPLTWKPEILSVCIFDAAVFDKIFAKLVKNGKEGTILAGPHGHGIPFNTESVHRYVDNPRTRSAARACLMLAWRHRSTLGLTTSGE
jgi:hypothetical protein